MSRGRLWWVLCLVLSIFSVSQQGLAKPPEKLTNFITALRLADTPMEPMSIEMARSWNLEPHERRLLTDALLARVHFKITKRFEKMDIAEVTALLQLYELHYDAEKADARIWIELTDEADNRAEKASKEFREILHPLIRQIWGDICVEQIPDSGNALQTVTDGHDEEEEDVPVFDRATDGQAAVVLADPSTEVYGDAIMELRDRNSPLIVGGILARLKIEVESKAGDAATIFAILRVLNAQLSDTNNKNRSAIYKAAATIESSVTDYIVKNSSDAVIVTNIFPELEAVLNLIALQSGFKPKPLASAPKVELASRMKAFRDYLEKTLIGQPEVVQAFYDLEFETQVKTAAGLEEPSFFLLMGQPGTGKDTAAKALVIAQLLFNPLVKDKRRAYDEHLFSVEVQKSESSAWGLLGSKTGYVGSNFISPFVKFMVAHSGGRYQIKRKKKLGGEEGEEYVEENPAWLGENLPYTFGPESGVVLLTELGDWSLRAKDLILKEFLETGMVRIGSPNGGLDRIYVPGVRVIGTTNEGTNLITNRLADGTRNGSPLPFQDVNSRYLEKSPNKDLLKRTLLKTNTLSTITRAGEEPKGTSEAIVNRTHPSRVILMAPHSPETQQRIARIFFSNIKKILGRATRGAYGAIQLEITDKAIQFVQEYDNIAEENSRPIKDRMRSLIEYTFYQALATAKLDSTAIEKGFTLSVDQNPDHTYSLILLEGTENATKEVHRQPILATRKELERSAIPDEKIDHILKVKDRLRDHVFGAEPVIDKLGDVLLLSEEARYARRKTWDSHTRATSVAYFGPSSTGKSETIKAVSRELYPEYGEQRRVDFDFNKVKNSDDVKTFIWGHGSGPTATPSEFMLKYDQYDGDLLIALEEFTNMPREVQKGFFDLFRENHPKFSDGEDRPMTNVSLSITGNVGLEWYSDVPKDVPLRVQMSAWARIYEDAMQDPELQRATLERHMPEPLINRIGMTNILWFSPHTFKSIRELTLAKLNKSVKSMLPSDGRRGWQVGFRSEVELFQAVKVIEREGFYLHEQGASIDRYVTEQLENRLRVLLLTHKIPSESKVAIVARPNQTEAEIQKTKSVAWDIYVEGKEQPLELRTFAQTRTPDLREVREHQILTGLHESGHEIVGKVLLGQEYRSKRISIIPGVGLINGKYLYYSGVREYDQVENIKYTREGFIREMASLLGGAAAERLYTQHGVNTAGVSNDIERATKLAENAVLVRGISRSLGLMSFANVDKSLMIEEDRRAASAEIRAMVDEAFALAKHVIESNQRIFENLAYEVMEKGELLEDDLDAFYQKHGGGLRLITDQRIPQPSSFQRTVDSITSWWQGRSERKHASAPDHRIRIKPSFKAPPVLASVTAIVENDMRKQQAQARMPKSLPIFASFTSTGSSDMTTAQEPVGCGGFLQKASGQ